MSIAAVISRILSFKAALLHTADLYNVKSAENAEVFEHCDVFGFEQRIEHCGIGAFSRSFVFENRFCILSVAEKNYRGKFGGIVIIRIKTDIEIINEGAGP